jgi:hypothetical protein
MVLLGILISFLSFAAVQMTMWVAFSGNVICMVRDLLVGHEAPGAGVRGGKVDSDLMDAEVVTNPLGQFQR